MCRGPNARRGGRRLRVDAAGPRPLQADRRQGGVTLGGGTPGEGFNPPGSAGSEGAPAGKRQREAKAAKLNLPTGLGGDKEHHAYTSDAPK